MTKEELEKEFDIFLKKNICFNQTGDEKSWGRKADSAVQNFALKYAHEILSKRGDIYLEAMEAIAAAQETIWKKVYKGDISVEGELKNPDAFWMSHFTSHIRYYLLKRLARRSSKKPVQQYKKEKEEHNDPKTKPSRYQGGRFDGFDEQHKSAMTEDFKEPEASEEDIVEMLEGKGIKLEVIEVLLLRASGYSYPEIGEKLDITKDDARMKFDRAIQEHDLDKRLINM